MSHSHHHPSKGKTRPVAETRWDGPGATREVRARAPDGCQPLPQSHPLSLCAPGARVCALIIIAALNFS